MGDPLVDVGADQVRETCALPGVAVRFCGGVDVVACSRAPKSPTQRVETFVVQPVEAVPVALSQADMREAGMTLK